MEAAYRRCSGDALGPNAHQKELAMLRLPLTRFEAEVVEVESKDAAQEALLCVREDGMSMEEVATEGRYPYRRVEFIFEDLAPEAQQRFLSVASGQVLPPAAHGDGFELCRVINKVEPQAEDPSVRARIEQRLVERHFTELASKHVEMRLGAAVRSEMKTQDSDILRRSATFRFLSDEHFAALEPLLQEESYDFGDVIVKQGDPANSFYILTRGRARALKIKDDGEEIPLGALKPGDSFGEAALMDGGLRMATVRCSTAVDVLRIDRDDFLQLVQQVPELKHYVEMTGRNRAVQSFLYQFSNFGRLPAMALRSMIDQLTPMVATKGDLIIQQGDAAGPMYVIEKGRARAFAGSNGQERNLAFYREGDFFGELSILNGSPRAASVEAFTDCQLLALEPQAVLDLRNRFPEFDKLLTERLAIYQAKTEARIPLDFTAEMLPAETQAHDKLEVDADQPTVGLMTRRTLSRTKKDCSANAASASARSSTSRRSMRWIAARRAWEWFAGISAAKSVSRASGSFVTPRPTARV